MSWNNPSLDIASGSGWQVHSLFFVVYFATVNLINPSEQDEAEICLYKQENSLTLNTQQRLALKV